jgi:hypothetical protein
VRPPEPRSQSVERVTRIELALSAWEAERLRLLRALTWQFRWSGVAVVDPSSPWLMGTEYTALVVLGRGGKTSGLLGSAAVLQIGLGHAQFAA